MPARLAHQLPVARIFPPRMAAVLAMQQMNDQGSCHCQGPECRHEYRSRGAVLGDANLWVMIRMQVVSKTLERRVEELGGNDRGTCERNERPPQWLRMCCNQNDDHYCQGGSLKFQTVFGSKAFH